jgi:hypothetical protein
MMCIIDQITNDQRAAYAEHALDYYAEWKEGRCNYDAKTAMAGDLITDLLHLIRSESGDPHAALRTAQINFEAEEADEATS